METKRGTTVSDPLMVTVKWPHHDDGGYGRLADFVPGEVMTYPYSTMAGSPPQRLWATAEFNGRLGRKVRRTGLVHLLYGDTVVAPVVARIDAPLVATLHIPLSTESPTRSIDRVREAVLRRCDAIVVLSSREREIAQTRFPGTRVVFIPHGIDLPAYQRVAVKSELPTLVVVGCNFRDWEMLHAVVQAAASARAGWQFHLVGVPEDRVSRLAATPQVVVHPRLSSDAYRELIGSAWGMFLPVKEATANNAMLEAHALGTPVVCSRIDGLTDYAIPTTRLFNSRDEAMDLLTEIVSGTESFRTSESERTAEAARRFDWRNVAEQVQELYAELR